MEIGMGHEVILGLLGISIGSFLLLLLHADGEKGGVCMCVCFRTSISDIGSSLCNRTTALISCWDE